MQTPLSPLLQFEGEPKEQAQSTLRIGWVFYNSQKVNEVPTLCNIEHGLEISHVEASHLKISVEHS